MFVVSISIKPKDDNSKTRESSGVADQSFIIKYNESEARDVISHILIQYDDYSFDAKYRLFLKISGIGLSKSEFGIIHDAIRKEQAKHFVEQNALMEYHVDHVMAREHTEMVKSLIKEWKYYFAEWEKAAYRESPDIKKLSRLSKLIHETMRILSEFNLGTNVILFIQKKMEMLENKSKALNITDLNNAIKYDNTNNIDNKVNDLSLPSETQPQPSAAATTNEEGQQGSNGGVIPKIKRNKSDNVQGSVLPSTEAGSGGTQTEITERARGAVF